MDERDRTHPKTTTTEIEREAREDAHRDPMTGEPGSHPVGTGVGAAGGAAAGAAVGGIVAGPVGAMIGAAVAGIVGGLAGHEVAESVNPTAEEEYWRGAWRTRPYASDERTWDELRPAYRHGWEARTRYPDRGWTHVEEDLEKRWYETHGAAGLGWKEARPAARDAWDRVTDRTYHDAWWRQAHPEQTWASGRDYDELQPAYRYGWESAWHHPNRHWDEIEPSLREGWPQARGRSHLGWDEVRDAVRSSWHRATQRFGRHEHHFRESWAERPYVRPNQAFSYDDYRPAYLYGWEAAHWYVNKRWENVERELAGGWDRAKGSDSRLSWEEAREATRDGWERARAGEKA